MYPNSKLYKNKTWTPSIALTVQDRFYINCARVYSNTPLVLRKYVPAHSHKHTTLYVYSSSFVSKHVRELSMCAPLVITLNTWILFSFVWVSCVQTDDSSAHGWKLSSTKLLVAPSSRKPWNKKVALLVEKDESVFSYWKIESFLFVDQPLFLIWLFTVTSILSNLM